MTIGMRVRKLVLARSMGYCEVGGEVLDPMDRALHHRKLRKQGGTDQADNVLVVCHGHHNLRSDSIHLNVSKASANGYLVQSWQEPSEVLVKIHGKHWAKLGTDGRYHEASPALQEIVTTISALR